MRTDALTGEGLEGADGRETQVGSIAEYPTLAKAQRAVEALRLKLNLDRPIAGPVSMAAVIDKYVADEMPERHSTRKSYLATLRKWIRPKWGEYQLDRIKAVNLTSSSGCGVCRLHRTAEQSSCPAAACTGSR